MFTWKPIYREIADKLLEYQGNSRDLVLLLKQLEDRGLKVSRLMDRLDSTGTEALLAEIDPFTFFSNFNRGISDDNRKAIIASLKAEWNLESPVPEDFAGLPVMSTLSSWFMPWGYNRTAEHVPKLWEFYATFLKVDDHHDLDTVLFDRCLKLQYVGLATLTMGMFWCRPDIWIALDARNKSYVNKHFGIDWIPKNGKQYLEWLDEVKVASNTAPCELSQSAYLNSDNNELVGFAPPFDRLFVDMEHANRVLDFFAKVLLQLDAGEENDYLVCSLRKTGRRGARMSVIYGNWMILRYERKSDVGSFEIIVPTESDVTQKHQVVFRYAHSADFGPFCTARVSENEVFENPDHYLNVMERPIQAVKKHCSDWIGSPYGRFHITGMIDAALDPSLRTDFVSQEQLVNEYDMDFWLLAPGKNAVYWESWQADGVGAIGWEEIGELDNYDSKEAIADAIAEHYPEDGPNSAAAMLWSFAIEMKPGDIVFAKKGLFKVCGWGIVTGQYAYDDSRSDYYHTIPIDWRCSQELAMPQGTQLAMQTLTRMTDKRNFLKDIAAMYPGVPGLSENGERPPKKVDPAPIAATYTKADALEDLFMSEEMLDRIISLIVRKKNIILQGAPGTGKTFIARRLAYLLMGTKDESRVPMVQFHQSTTYEDFIQGYRPNGDNGFSLQNGCFYEFVTRAQQNSDLKFVFVIDEINRGNLSKVFGELMMLIETDKRKKEFALPLSYASDNQDRFFIPPNVYLIGTMNTADRSLSLVDYALRRRFAFIELEPGFDTPGFQRYLQKREVSAEIISEIRLRMEKLNNLIMEDGVNLGRGYRIGHSFFVPAEGHVPNQQWLQEIVEFEIIPLLEEYWCDDPSKLERAKRIARGQP